MDHRGFAPAASRNRGPILDVLRGILPPTGYVLELASGTGEHVVHFAENLPGLTFQPTDPDPVARQSVAAWSAACGTPNVLPPVALDATEADWPIGKADALICINMIHIAPWRATEGLFQHASRLLPRGAPVYLYGPFRHQDAVWADSNAAFDRSLKARNPDWGVRSLESVARIAAAHGFGPATVTAMPANNLSVVFRAHDATPSGG
jgi:hypothetical protein